MTFLASNIAILLIRSFSDTPPLTVVSILLVILVIILFRKRITRLTRLWYISLVYGRYSYEFLTFFKENNLLSPYNGCIKDEIAMHFVVFYKKIKNSQEFLTETSIDYGRIPFMATCKTLFRIKGTPGCMKIAVLNGNKFKVVGYNETLQGMKMKSMYFFLDDHFVMGELMFSDLTRVKPAILIGTLSSKYLNGDAIEKEVCYIEDSKGNQLNYEHNGFAITIKYLFRGDQKTNMTLSALFPSEDEQIENNLKVLRHEELLDRF